MQTCAGHDAGSEATIHAMKSIFNDNTQVALLIDAFNLVNHQAALHNISVLCPSFSTTLNNTYGPPIRLFITDEGELSSTKGITQGDPLAMVMYAIAVNPLINHLHQSQPDISQVCYATAVGLLQWWKLVSSTGPCYGYFPNAIKTYLIVKPQYISCLCHSTFPGY